MSMDGVYHRFLSGDDCAFTALMETFGNPLTLYIYGYTGNFDDAEDLMIEVFSYLIVKRPKIRAGCLKPYLYQAARRIALRSIQKRNRYFSMNLDQIQELSDERAMVDVLVDTQEKHRILHLCMDDLSPDYREAIYLVYFENMSHREAATIMGKRERQIADLVYRGRKSLKIKLEQEGITHA